LLSLLSLLSLLLCFVTQQTALGSAGLDVDAIIRRALLDECTDWTKAAANTSSAQQQQHQQQRRTVLDSMRLYYLHLLKRISPDLSNSSTSSIGSSDSSGVAVYVPARCGFVCLPGSAAKVQAGALAAPADLFLDAAEFKALCTLLGGGGARAVEQVIQRVELATSSVDSAMCLAA
jgi:Membrane-associated apoptosis protein